MYKKKMQRAPLATWRIGGEGVAREAGGCKTKISVSPQKPVYIYLSAVAYILSPVRKKDSGDAGGNKRKPLIEERLF